MRYHSSQRNIVWTVLLLLCTVLSLNGCGDANNVTGPPAPVPLSPDAKLSSLTVTSGPLDPGFSSDVANYTVDVATSVTSVTVAAQPQASGATVSINGQTSNSQSVPLGIPGSNTPIPIIVTAQSGSQNTYIVTVNRTALAGNNNLQGLTLSPGSLAPAFTSSRLSYSVNVSSSVASVIVAAQPQDAGATVSINGQTARSLTVSLGAEGSITPISIEVTAPNTNQKTYTVLVNRALPSGNNNLSALNVSAGPLTPAFDFATTTYDVVAPNGTTNTTVTATVADSAATLTINGSPATSGVGAQIDLVSGQQNSIFIVITAENNVSNTYRVNITVP
jgi:hypothetical protein